MRQAARLQPWLVGYGEEEQRAWHGHHGTASAPDERRPVVHPALCDRRQTFCAHRTILPGPSGADPQAERLPTPVHAGF
jgi:hypothetical protein